MLLIWKGQTTVESMHARQQKERESQGLNDTFGFCGIVCVPFHPFGWLWMALDIYPFVCRDKKIMQKAWDEEWGSIDKEGNLWWLGSGKKEWEEVMGKNPWGWFCEYFHISFSSSFFLQLSVPIVFSSMGAFYTACSNLLHDQRGLAHSARGSCTCGFEWRLTHARSCRGNPTNSALSSLF